MAQAPNPIESKSVFSRNQKDVVISSPTPMTIVIRGSIHGGELSFTQSPANGKIVIQAADLIHNALPDYDPTSRVADQIRSDDLHVSLSALNQDDTCVLSMEGSIIKGGHSQIAFPKEKEYLQSNFLTLRPQICRTEEGILEELSYFQNGLATVAIKVKIFFQTTLPQIFFLDTLERDQTLWRIDCSYQRIRDMALQNGFSDPIRAYDIFGVGSEHGSNAQIYRTNVPFAQRFVVCPPDARRTYFLFQNSLGGFDTICASGPVKIGAECEIQSYSNHGEEFEVSSGYSETTTVNTGFIKDTATRKLWFEFFRSSNRYLQTANGLQRIVLEKCDAEHTNLQLNDYTFQFRLSAPEKGAGEIKRTEIQEFF